MVISDGLFPDHFGQAVTPNYIPQYYIALLLPLLCPNLGLFSRYLSFVDHWFRERRSIQEAYYLNRFVDKVDSYLPMTKELIGYCINGISYHHRAEMWLKVCKPLLVQKRWRLTLFLAERSKKAND